MTFTFDPWGKEQRRTARWSSMTSTRSSAGSSPTRPTTPTCAHPVDRAHPSDGRLGLHAAHRVPVTRAGSGKTRALEVSELLVPRPVEAVNTTPAYLFRKVSDPAGPPTILYDEIDTLFGPKAKDNEEIRGMLNAGHRRGAMAGRCVVKGKVVETEELPAYCALALAGLGDLPDTLMSRSVVIRMRRRAPGETSSRSAAACTRRRARICAISCTAWAAAVDGRRERPWPDMPAGIADRDADVWEALLAVADAAGGDWPELARVAAVALVADSKAGSPSLGVRLLADLREDLRRRRTPCTPRPSSTALHSLDEAPWGDLKGKPLDPAARLAACDSTACSPTTCASATGPQGLPPRRPARPLVALPAPLGGSLVGNR